MLLYWVLGKMTANWRASYRWGRLMDAWELYIPALSTLFRKKFYPLKWNFKTELFNTNLSVLTDHSIVRTLSSQWDFWTYGDEEELEILQTPSYLRNFCKYRQTYLVHLPFYIPIPFVICITYPVPVINFIWATCSLRAYNS